MLAQGRNFDFQTGRDANGPIFPLGDVDRRVPVHEDVIGVITASENVRLVLAAGGIKAVDADGTDLGSHQALWFAWSRFHPQTALWTS